MLCVPGLEFIDVPGLERVKKRYETITFGCFLVVHRKMAKRPANATYASKK